jgi:hypothetical protein
MLPKKQRKKLNEYHILASLLLAGYLLVSFFDPENGGSMFLRNINSKDNTLNSQCYENLKSNISNECQYFQYVTGTRFRLWSSGLLRYRVAVC